MCCLSSETSALNGTSSPNMQGVSAPSSLGEFLLLTSDLTSHIEVRSVHHNWVSICRLFAAQNEP